MEIVKTKWLFNVDIYIKNVYKRSINTDKLVVNLYQTSGKEQYVISVNGLWFFMGYENLRGVVWTNSYEIEQPPIDKGTYVWHFHRKNEKYVLVQGAMIGR